MARVGLSVGHRPQLLAPALGADPSGTLAVRPAIFHLVPARAPVLRQPRPAAAAARRPCAHDGRRASHAMAFSPRGSPQGGGHRAETSRRGTSVLPGASGRVGPGLWLAERAVCSWLAISARLECRSSCRHPDCRTRALHRSDGGPVVAAQRVGLRAGGVLLPSASLYSFCRPRLTARCSSASEAARRSRRGRAACGARAATADW